MDELKKYLSDNQDDISKAFPLPDGHNVRFQDKIVSQKSGVTIIKRLILAGISVAALFALYFSLTKPAAAPESQIPPQLSDISNEMQQVEQFFTERLNNSQLPPLNEDPVLTKQMQLLGELEKDYQDLRLALQQNFGNQHVIDAMIKNYQMRIRIMEQMKKYNEIKNTHSNTSSNESHS